MICIKCDLKKKKICIKCTYQLPQRNSNKGKKKKTSLESITN